MMSVVKVEVVRQSAMSDVSPAMIQQLLRKMFTPFFGSSSHFTPTISSFDDPVLQMELKSVHLDDGGDSNKITISHDTHLDFFIYYLNEGGPEVEEVEEEDNLPAANLWQLPNHDFHGLWESLVFDVQIKDRLLQLMNTSLLFSDKKVNSRIISVNRVVLLHGPPGTGKTSLCKALAQKLVVRLSDRYEMGWLIEINSHSLFSKWFSESGKLVMKMFSKIHEYISQETALVCVLIDEVESLAHARKSSMSGSEPSDAIRVVNALLTQIDSIQRYPNVLVLTTSNITGAIDLAFVDRADIKQFIGLPNEIAIYQIFHSCIIELQKTGIVKSCGQLVEYKDLRTFGFARSATTAAGLSLMEIAKRSDGLSGRTLRKLPFLAHAFYIKQQSCTLDEFIRALGQAVDKQHSERAELGAESNT